MSKLLTRSEATDIFSTFAYAYKINFYSDFDIDSRRYVGLFEDSNKNNSITLNVHQDGLTIDFVHNVLRSVRDAFMKEV